MKGKMQKKMTKGHDFVKYMTIKIQNQISWKNAKNDIGP